MSKYVPQVAKDHIEREHTIVKQMNQIKSRDREEQMSSLLTNTDGQQGKYRGSISAFKPTNQIEEDELEAQESSVISARTREGLDGGISIVSRIQEKRKQFVEAFRLLDKRTQVGLIQLFEIESNNLN
jgi:hypothetical protein